MERTYGVKTIYASRYVKRRLALAQVYIYRRAMLVTMPSKEHQHGVTIQSEKNFSDERANGKLERQNSWRGCSISTIYDIPDS